MVWYGMVWYGMVWYGMVWYGMLLGEGPYERSVFGSQTPVCWTPPSEQHLLRLGKGEKDS